MMNFQPGTSPGLAPQSWGASPSGVAFPQSPPQTPPPISDPEPASKKFQEEATEYVGKFCKASKAFVQAKRGTFDKWLKLYRGELSSWDWQRGDISQDLAQTRASTFPNEHEDGSKIGLADYVHPVSPLVHAHAHNAYLSIFSGPEYLTIISEDETGAPSGDEQYPTEYKIQQLLLRKLAQGKVHATTFKSLVRLPLFGTVAGKVYWHSHKVPRWKWDLQSFQKIRTEETVFECPIICPIPLDRWLPDPQAMDSNVALWRGVGHFVTRTYEDIDASFARGTYNLNYAEFKRRWEKSRGGEGPNADDGLTTDPDANQEDDSSKQLDVWEWHGRIPSRSQGGLVECCCTFITEKGALSVEDGVLARLTTEPLLSSGMRPMVCAHWTEGAEDSAFGQGMLAENEDTLYTLSQFIGQMQDVARHTAIPSIMAREGSALYTWLKKRGIRQPGDVAPFEDPSDVKEFPAIRVPTTDLVQLIQMLKGDIEQISGQTQTWQGVASGETATGASIAQKQSSAPNQTKTELFVANYLEPAFNIALGMLQQFTLTDQTVMIKTAGGQVQPLTVTAEELQRGRFSVKVTLTDQSHTRVATAQAAQRILEIMPTIKPIIQSEGWDASAAETFNMLIDGLDTHRGDRILRKISTPEQMLMQENAALKQQLASIPQPKAPGANGSSPGVSPPDRHPGEGGPLAEQGGPLGPEVNDENAMMQQLQLEMQMMAPGQSQPGQGGGLL